MAQPAVVDPFAELRNCLPWLLTKATFQQAIAFYRESLNDPSLRDNPEVSEACLAILGRGDRFFLLTHLLHRVDAVHPWLYERCREVENDPDGYLDLWARDHYKSTIITFAGAIQEILNDPNITIGIFSHTRPTAKKFLSQIKNELELNEDLKRVFPDVLWQNPHKDAVKWSLDEGISVKRSSNPKEQTVEAWGLVDGQPTGSHFALGIFDDVVTLASVTTSDQIIKTTEALDIAQNLLSSAKPRQWMIGTRYKHGDTYQQLIERGAVKTRIHPATDDGTFDGKPVFLSEEVWNDKKRKETTSTIATQQLQNPTAGSEQKFKEAWLRRYEVRPFTLNVYIMGDYAGSRSTGKGSSNTAFAVVGVDSALNKYLLDGAVHRMTLTERWLMLRNLRRKWLDAPGVQIVEVGYERFGAQSDIEHFESQMLLEGESFDIKELNWARDGDSAKDNRIERLEPDLRNSKMWLPYDPEVARRELLRQGKSIENFDPITSTQRKVIDANQEYLVAKPIKQINQDGQVYNLVEWVIQNEYKYFPNTTKKDFLDAWSRIYDMEISAPVIYSDEDLMPEPVEE